MGIYQSHFTKRETETELSCMLKWHNKPNQRIELELIQKSQLVTSQQKWIGEMTHTKKIRQYYIQYLNKTDNFIVFFKNT